MNFNQNIILGKVGFTLTSEICSDLCNKLLAYATVNDYSNIIIGNNGSFWAKEFYNDILNKLKPFKNNIITIDRPTTLYEVGWLSTEIKIKSITIYISESLQGSEYLSISLFKEELQPLMEQDLNTLSFKQAYNDEYNNHDITTVKINNLIHYLEDTKLIDIKNFNNINFYIDSMFGAGEYFFKDFETITKLKTSFFNSQSSPSRYLNYTSNPTGQFLSNYAKICINRADFNNIFVGISPDGEKLGFYDLKQDIEINSYSVIALLAYYYAKIKKRTGTILLTSLAADKTLELINNLNLSYEIIDCGYSAFYNALKNKRKRPILFYANEYGNIWFKNDIPICNPFLTILNIASLCQDMSRSPGEIIDIINTAFIKNNYYHFTYAITKNILNKQLFENIIEDSIIDKKNYTYSSIYKLKDGLRLALKDNLNYNRLELYLDATNQDKLKDMANYLQNEVSKLCLDIY